MVYAALLAEPLVAAVVAALFDVGWAVLLGVFWLTIAGATCVRIAVASLLSGADGSAKAAVVLASLAGAVGALILFLAQGTFVAFSSI